jgi:hypothetical protein
LKFCDCSDRLDSKFGKHELILKSFFAKSFTISSIRGTLVLTHEMK